MIRTAHVWILVLVALTLSGFAMWQRSIEVLDQQDEVVLLLPQNTISWSEIETITLNRKGEKIVFERVEGIWWQTRPFYVQNGHKFDAKRYRSSTRFVANGCCRR